MSQKSWFDDLKAKFPTMVLGQATPSASNANKHPRDALLALIANSRSLLADPDFTINKRGKQTKPEACFKLQGDSAEVVLRYAHEKLTLPDGSTAITVPAKQLPKLLDALQAVVEAKAFDDQLEAIKAERVANLKAAGAGKKAAA